MVFEKGLCFVFMFWVVVFWFCWIGVEKDVVFGVVYVDVFGFC